MYLRRSVGSVPGLLLAACLAATADAATVTLADFESGLPAGWQATPGGWVVGGTTNTSPNILPAQGALFARCGAPNVASEAAVGTLLSPPLVVRSQQLAWISCGWSGQFGNGLNRFEILNAQQQVVATVATPLSDAWTPRSVDMFAAGFAVGDTFYFRAVDTNTANSYAWLAMDDLRFEGAECAADLNGSGQVDGADLGMLLASWGAPGAADLDHSGAVDGADIGLLLAAWGACGA